MRGVLVDTSAWIDFFAGKKVVALEEGLAAQAVILSPVVIAELVSGAIRRHEREAILEIIQDLPVHETPRRHWIDTGKLRRQLGSQGLSVSTPDAHIAQCALDRDAFLLTGDGIFEKISEKVPLKLILE